MQIFLESERLVLRRFTAADVEDLVELDSDPDVMRFVSGGEPTSRIEIERDILPAFLAYYTQFESYGFWAAIEKWTGEFLGWFHFRPLAGALGDAELGYRLRKAAWGKGYATEGARALIRNGFTNGNVQRVVASTLVVHAASRRVLEKAGLKPVRLFHKPWPERIEGDEQSDIDYCVTRAEWAHASDGTGDSVGDRICDRILH